jgi:hypothetical protein
MMVLFVAAHESAVGTFETCQGGVMMSVVRGRPEVTGTRPTDAIDPNRKSRLRRRRSVRSR